MVQDKDILCIISLDGQSSLNIVINRDVKERTNKNSKTHEFADIDQEGKT